MPAQGQQLNGQPMTRPTYEELVREVARRVWELWQQDLRREQERRGRVVRR
jgi:hypothetical protein